MKNTFSRLFGFGDKESEFELQNESHEEIDKKIHEEIQEIPIANIIPNRYQPRTVFDAARIDELALTIRTHGLIQPIVIRKYEEDKYEIIAGERRFRAATKLGWEKVPAIIKNLNDTETASVALIENLQREELTAIEEAVAYQKLIELHNLTQEALAQRLGKGQSTIANKLRLLKLPEEIKRALLEKSITERHARALIPLKNEELQLKVLQEIVEKQLNVKQTEERIAKLLEEVKPKRKAKQKAVSRDMRIAMNTIRQSLQMVTNSGLKVNSEEEEFDEYYQITIKIPKKK
ncbi:MULTISPECIES: nucleoid occlusion protein [Bacillus]|uniref:Nucleoid occlusion protein n=1 Tax=Bacillus pseudomycoides TaxID=64104 RepID=A0A2A8GYK7_9BACI|nr:MULTISPECIES: nucleoid occlusion protein [Bacillus]AIK38477.1 nucleoid occlusion protein [Bacillus pseudomycoides]AJI19416.1 nucleoid occlusion protein [Bacillus pseudomycoides]EEM08579.1 Nucleoid occlusion protein [Bacillus pseudomycoides]EEM14306.1 Nucleoid occlusion protein [Bacillus pseudomycoides DSM 12442]KFN09385.1 nucleoid occlusion protein [Bacillus pseudomycoides]